MFYFNPRLREGGDKMVERTISLHRISIHASAREATALSCRLCRTHRYFNPRLREGGDARTIKAILQRLAFQSTPPRGRRPVTVLRMLIRSSFQSTPPRGRRRCTKHRVDTNFYFNPRLREGGDQAPYTQTSLLINISIHASAREATALITNFYI